MKKLLFLFVLIFQISYISVKVEQTKHTTAPKEVVVTTKHEAFQYKEVESR
jgi:Na+-transporting methylmalonyl-CoA/oxaloacetate decarboxylase gamma subunit